MSICLRRREFIAGLGAASAVPRVACAQQPRLPVVGFIYGGFAEPNADNAAAFRKGLNQSGYVDGQNVAVEYRWLDGQWDRLPAVVADLDERFLGSNHIRLHRRACRTMCERRGSD